MKKLRAAVIGVGYLGRFHAQKYKALESELPIELVGVCDVNEIQAVKVAAELGVSSFQRPRDLLGEVDLVTIATVTRMHSQVARAFLEAGVHCLVEKPITETAEEAEELVELAELRNLVLGVGHSERFNPAYLKARELVPEPSLIELNRHAPYKSRGADVSVVHDLMVHDLDLLCDLSPGPVRLSRARGGKLLSPTLDWATAAFELGESGSGLIAVSRVASQMTRELRLIDARQTVVANLQTGDVQVVRFESPDSPVVEDFACGRGDNLLNETREFIKAVLGQPSIVVRGPEGLRAMRWILEVMKDLEVR